MAFRTIAPPQLEDHEQAQPQGYDCVFVEKPPSEEFETDTECSICTLVLREPSQSECCGNVFCSACIKKSIRENNACPICRRRQPLLFRDQRFERSLLRRKVYCSHSDRAEGGGGGGGVCEWVGELRELEKHLNQTPSAEDQLSGCGYAVIKCKFCDKPFKRLHIESHQSNECPEREYTCCYCGLKKTYMFITEIHKQECLRYPVQCQHCNETCERQNLKHHIDNECACAPVICAFQKFGCQMQLPRIEMTAHVKNKLAYHASLLVTYAANHRDNIDLDDCLLMLTNCIDTLSGITSENAALTAQKKKWQLFSLVFVILLAIVLYVAQWFSLGFVIIVLVLVHWFV